MEQKKPPGEKKGDVTVTKKKKDAFVLGNVHPIPMRCQEKSASHKKRPSLQKNDDDNQEGNEKNHPPQKKKKKTAAAKISGTKQQRYGRKEKEKHVVQPERRDRSYQTKKRRIDKIYKCLGKKKKNI